MLNKRAFYGDDWGVPSAEHPAGECLNRSAPGVEDGSYFEKSWVNDLMALSGALMNSAGYSPNGTEDTAMACQVFDALVNNRWSAIGNYSPGTVVTASDGYQYYCKKQSGRDSSPADPTSDLVGNWKRYPYKKTVNGNLIQIEYFDGRILIYGDAIPSSGIATVSLPVSIPNLTASGVRITSLIASSPSSFSSIPQVTLIDSSINSGGFQVSCILPDESPSTSTISWSVEGNL